MIVWKRWSMVESMAHDVNASLYSDSIALPVCVCWTSLHACREAVCVNHRCNKNHDRMHLLLWYCWQNSLRNTQKKMHGKYMGNIQGIFKEYMQECTGTYEEYPKIFMIKNNQQHRTRPHWGRRRRRCLCVLCFWIFYIINICRYSSYILVYSCVYSVYTSCIFSIYVPLDVA